MNTTLIFAVLGPDRPGLVQRLAEIVAEHQGNWLESRMIRLGGQFSGIVRTSLDQDQHVEALSEALRNFDPNFQVTVETEGDQRESYGPLIELSIQGQDRVGIVREVTSLLGHLHVNVEELHSEALAAPMTGESLFHLDALLRLPADLDLDQLQLEVETLSDDLVVDVEAVE